MMMENDTPKIYLHPGPTLPGILRTAHFANDISLAKRYFVASQYRQRVFRALVF